jgi:hypothetical protein
MKEVRNLVPQYVPVDPARLAAVKGAGKVSIQLTEPGKRARLVFSDYLKKGDNVALVGFGTFEVRKRAARAGRNPSTGEAIKIKAAKVPAFKAGATLKAAVNGAKK